MLSTAYCRIYIFCCCTYGNINVHLFLIHCLISFPLQNPEYENSWWKTRVYWRCWCTSKGCTQRGLLCSLERIHSVLCSTWSTHCSDIHILRTDEPNIQEICSRRHKWKRGWTVIARRKKTAYCQASLFIIKAKEAVLYFQFENILVFVSITYSTRLCLFVVCLLAFCLVSSVLFVQVLQ